MRLTLKSTGTDQIRAIKLCLEFCIFFMLTVSLTAESCWWQSYIYQVLQTITLKLILLCEPAVLGSAKTALTFKYKIQIGYYSYTIQCMGQFISFKSEINNP